MLNNFGFIGHLSARRGRGTCLKLIVRQAHMFKY
jgi:hypothetical protein